MQYAKEGWVVSFAQQISPGARSLPELSLILAYKSLAYYSLAYHSLAYYSLTYYCLAFIDELTMLNLL